jgi:hypothetical protein
MNFWTLICIIIIIGVAGDALKKAFRGSAHCKDPGIDMQTIDELTRRINELEERKGLKEIEIRLQALESIMVDGDYVLDMKFKKAFG